MDDIDLRIAKILAEDGRLANSEIARRLAVSEGTVRQRLKRLIASKAVQIRVMVSSEQFAEFYFAVIGLSIEGRQLGKCAEQIDRFPEVQQTLIVTGRYDLLVSLLLKSRADLVEFVTHKLSTVPGIRNSETFVCLKNYDPWFEVTSVDRPQDLRAKSVPDAVRGSPRRRRKQ
jgi:Lrp/AsnC family transcriptional regulator for asnA, asnC and gidA